MKTLQIFNQIAHVKLGPMGPPPHLTTPEAFQTYVKGLREVDPTQPPVKGIKIHFGHRVIIRLKDREKIFTITEVEKLAEFYDKPLTDIRELFKKRKFTIIGETDANNKTKTP